MSENSLDSEPKLKPPNLAEALYLANENAKN